MKTMTRLGFLTLFLIAIQIPAFASEQGGNSSGGGNSEASTKTQVAQTVHNLYRGELQAILFQIYEHVRPGAPLPLINPTLNEVFNKMFGHEGNTVEPAVYRVLKNTRFLVEIDHGCKDQSDGAEHDSSTWEDATGTAICFSAARLTRLPPNALAEQINALTLHELTHHFGFDEATAQLVQDYVLGALRKPCTIEVSLKTPEGSSKASQILWFMMSPHLPGALNVIYEAKFVSGGTIRLGNTNGEYHFAFSYQSSKLDFNYVNAIGAVSEGHLSWGELIDTPNSDSYESYATSLDASFDGSPLVATQVLIAKSCFGN